MQHSSRSGGGEVLSRASSGGVPARLLEVGGVEAQADSAQSAHSGQAHSGYGSQGHALQSLQSQAHLSYQSQPSQSHVSQQSRQSPHPSNPSQSHPTYQSQASHQSRHSHSHPSHPTHQTQSHPSHPSSCDDDGTVVSHSSRCSYGGTHAEALVGPARRDSHEREGTVHSSVRAGSAASSRASYDAAVSRVDRRSPSSSATQDSVKEVQHTSSGLHQSIGMQHSSAASQGERASQAAARHPQQVVATVSAGAASVRTAGSATPQLRSRASSSQHQQHHGDALARRASASHSEASRRTSMASVKDTRSSLPARDSAATGHEAHSASNTTSATEEIHHEEPLGVLQMHQGVDARHIPKTHAHRESVVLLEPPSDNTTEEIQREEQRIRSNQLMGLTPSWQSVRDSDTGRHQAVPNTSFVSELSDTHDTSSNSVTHVPVQDMRSHLSASASVSAPSSRRPSFAQPQLLPRKPSSQWSSVASSTTDAHSSNDPSGTHPQLLQPPRERHPAGAPRASPCSNDAGESGPPGSPFNRSTRSRISFSFATEYTATEEEDATTANESVDLGDSNIAGYRLREIYDRLDTKQRNWVTRAQLIQALRTDAEVRRLMHLPAHIAQSSPSHTDFEMLFQALDVKNKRGISWEEFRDVFFSCTVQNFRPKTAPAHSIPKRSFVRRPGVPMYHEEQEEVEENLEHEEEGEEEEEESPGQRQPDSEMHFQRSGTIPIEELGEVLTQVDVDSVGVMEITKRNSGRMLRAQGAKVEAKVARQNEPREERQVVRERVSESESEREPSRGSSPSVRSVSGASELSSQGNTTRRPPLPTKTSTQAQLASPQQTPHDVLLSVEQPSRANDSERGRSGRGDGSKSERRGGGDRPVQDRAPEADDVRGEIVWTKSGGRRSFLDAEHASDAPVGARAPRGTPLHPHPDVAAYGSVHSRQSKQSRQTDSGGRRKAYLSVSDAVRTSVKERDTERGSGPRPPPASMRTSPAQYGSDVPETLDRVGKWIDSATPQPASEVRVPKSPVQRRRPPQQRQQQSIISEEESPLPSLQHQQQHQHQHQQQQQQQQQQRQPQQQRQQQQQQQQHDHGHDLDQDQDQDVTRTDSNDNVPVLSIPPHSSRRTQHTSVPHVKSKPANPDSARRPQHSTHSHHTHTSHTEDALSVSSEDGVHPSRPRPSTPLQARPTRAAPPGAVSTDTPMKSPPLPHGSRGATQSPWRQASPRSPHARTDLDQANRLAEVAERDMKYGDTRLERRCEEEALGAYQNALALLMQAIDVHTAVRDTGRASADDLAPVRHYLVLSDVAKQRIRDCYRSLGRDAPPASPAPSPGLVIHHHAPPSPPVVVHNHVHNNSPEGQHRGGGARSISPARPQHPFPYSAIQNPYVQQTPTRCVTGERGRAVIAVSPAPGEFRTLQTPTVVAELQQAHQMQQQMHHAHQGHLNQVQQQLFPSPGYAPPPPARLRPHCTRCGQAADLSANFCQACGAPVSMHA